ncbi:E3 ubiquitin-protein ligase MARCHF3-like [Tachypleus tridentatus]|uniref:E3 ubiquitin-protein ligase MARCHF3-like n=1 Tax=Tachypleus tridentatus TaxID=6853 RepID=UPI003FD24D2E
MVNDEPTDTSYNGGSITDKKLIKKDSDTSTLLCRICFRGSSKENLISPCKCKGTMGQVHRLCLERWLGSRSDTTCELCNFQFCLHRKPKGFCEWFNQPENIIDRRNLIGDLICFLLLTPLATVSGWLCIEGARYYNFNRTSTWESVGLIMLTVFLVIVYFIWITVSLRLRTLVGLTSRRSHKTFKANVHQI